MDIPELETALATVRARLSEALRISHGNLTSAEFQALEEACLDAERALALAKGEETALACPWEAPWDVGAPLPHVIAGCGKVFLIYAVGKSDLPWHSTYLHASVSDDDDYSEHLALVEFLACYAFKYGGTHHDVIHRHPLYGKGVEPYRAHIVASSRWLAEEEQINLADPDYDPESWAKYRHYLLVFHDELFECIARSYQTERILGSYERVLQIATGRLW